MRKAHGHICTEACPTLHEISDPCGEDWGEGRRVGGGREIGSSASGGKEMRRTGTRTDFERSPRRLWIGSMHAAKDAAVLSSRGITHVVSLGTDNYFGTAAASERGRGGVRCLHLPSVLDVTAQDILPLLPRCVAFMAEGLQNDGGGGVLVHCVYGQSRSATVCIAFLLALEAARAQRRQGTDAEFRTPGQSLCRALCHVRASRPCVSVNRCFLWQLGMFATSLRGLPPPLETSVSASIAAAAAKATATTKVQAGAIADVPAALLDAASRLAQVGTVPRALPAAYRLWRLGLRAGKPRRPGRRAGAAGGATGVPLGKAAARCARCRATLCLESSVVDARYGLLATSVSDGGEEELLGACPLFRAAPQDYSSSGKQAQQGKRGKCDARGTRAAATAAAAAASQAPLLVAPEAWSRRAVREALDRGERSGKLNCPSCGSKVGAWTLEGLACDPPGCEHKGRFLLCPAVSLSPGKCDLSV